MPGTKQTREDKTECLLQYIAEHVYEHGYQPSMRELAEMMGYSSVGYIQTLLSKVNNGRTNANAMQSRAVCFDWKSYLPQKSLPWNGRQAPHRNTAKRVAAKRRGGAK